MGKADLHIHTAASDGMAEVGELLDYVETCTDLDIIAITDHDDIEGALEARESWAKRQYRFELVVGIEATALEGHILGLYLEEPLPSLRPAEEILEAIHRQGGIAIAAHPMCWITRSLSRTDLNRLHYAAHEGVSLDAIEVSGQPICRWLSRRRTERLNQRIYHLPEIGGSDAHFLKAIGTTYTEFEGTSASALRRAISEGRCRAVVGRYPSILDIGLGQMLRQSYRGISTTPRKLGWRSTAISFVKRIFSFAR